MRRSRHVLRFVLLVSACFLCFTLSVRSFVAEYDAVVLLNGTPGELISALDAGRGDMAQPGSARTTRDLMLACGRIITLAPQLKADATLAKRVGQSCHDIAVKIVAKAPSNARARAVLLLTAPSLSADDLRIAQAAAPFEPWPLNIRLQAVARDAAPSADVIAVAGEDFARALLSDWGKRETARIYLGKPSLRPVIVAEAERLPADDQAAFLGLVRRGNGGLTP